MRVLFVGQNGYGYPHTRVRCYHFARALSTIPGFEPAVLSFRDDLAPHHSEAAMYESLRDREKIWLSLKAISRLWHERDSVIYLQKAHFHAAAPYLLHRTGILPNYIFDYDDYDVPLSNFFGRGIHNRVWFGSNRWDEITWRLARGARGCVAASHALMDVLSPHNSNVHYIPTGVDPHRFTPTESKQTSEPLTLLWNGLIWGEPIAANLRYLFRALEWVIHRMPAFRLLIIGGGAQWEATQAHAHRNHPGLPIEWKGWVEPDEMPRYLREADIALLPTDGDDEWLRCKSPTKLFEYMATGLPVVASSVGEVTHVMEHQRSGMLVHDERDFGQAVLRLSTNPDVRTKIGAAARDRIIESFALPVLGEHLADFLTATFESNGVVR